MEMKTREENSVHIQVIAASSDRRRALVALAGAADPRVRIRGSSSAEQMVQFRGEIIVVDIDSPRIAGAVIRAAQVLPAGTGLIALADMPDPEWVRSALRVGVNAVLSREPTNEEIRLAFLAVEAGLVLLHPSSAPWSSLGRQNRIPGDLAEQDFHPLIEALTTREHEVLRLLGEGLSNKEIASRLNVSDHTVKFHISAILGKLDASSRTEAVSHGIRRGLIVI